MAIKFDFTKTLQFLFVAVLIIFLLYQFINFSAIGGTGDVLKTDVNVKGVTLMFFQLIIVFVATFLALKIVFVDVAGGQRLDTKYFLTLMIWSVVLYGLYAYLIQPGVCGTLGTNGVCALPDLRLMATQLYSISPAPIQSIFGMP